uniref:G-protein coupled receptors family 1 profile domain-containing protein n=1 Tax=Parascaris univalens TaxID=6257 RepID=A0A915BAY0_PARUN
MMEMNETVRRLLCNSADRLYFDSPLMKLIFISELVGSTVAAAFAALMALAILLTRVLHFNVRLLLVCTCVAMLISNTGIFITARYFVDVIFVKPVAERCASLLFGRVKCAALRKLYNAGGMMVVMSTVFLAVERLVATCTFKTYEARRRIWLGVTLSALLWATFIHSCFFMPEQGVGVYQFCDTGIYDVQFSKIVDLVLLAIELLAAIIFVGLWHSNYRRMRTLDDRYLRVLSTRYQLNENVNTTKLMIPIVSIGSVLMFSYSFAYYALLPSLDRYSEINENILNSVNAYAPIAEFLVLLMPVVTSAFMISTPMLSVHVRRSLFRLTGLRRCVRQSFNKTESAQEAATRTHFELLKKQWEGKLAQHQRGLSSRSQSYIL